ncbi:MAG: AAA family ATPase, partial [Eubacteriales bacterium]|nr:AAA family ATPase [Eubacteriales bacterium]
MKPKTLKITGINSFNEEQTIDFSKLMCNGIFGIFGDTGSGKSTIIDAITLALYGKIVRHKSKNKNGDFINLNRKNAKVEFEFSIKEGNNRKNFAILRQFKKDKDGNIKSDITRLINVDKQEIISDKKTEIEEEIKNIIGLNYDDFTKAVILPQGKFSEFL